MKIYSIVSIGRNSKKEWMISIVKCNLLSFNIPIKTGHWMITSYMVIKFYKAHIQYQWYKIDEIKYVTIYID